MIITEGSACLPADDNSAARLMSELSPRLQPLTTSFDNSPPKTDVEKTPRDARSSAARCPWQPRASRAYSHSIDTSDSACSQSPPIQPPTHLCFHLSSSLSVRHSQSLFITPLLGFPAAESPSNEVISPSIISHLFQQKPMKRPTRRAQWMNPSNNYCLRRA